MTTTLFESLAFHAPWGEAEACQNRPSVYETQMNCETNMNYPDRRGDSLLNPNVSEMRQDLRVTVKRIRHFDTIGDTVMARALRFTARRLRDAIRVSETQITFVPESATYMTIKLHDTTVL